MFKYNKIHTGDTFKLIKKIEDNSIDLIICDPPSGAKLVKAGWDKYKNSEDYVNYLSSIIWNSERVLKESGSLYLHQWIGEKNPLHMAKVLVFIEENTNLIFKDIITWRKNRGCGNRKGWLYVREEILQYVKSNKEFVWNKEAQYSDEKRPYKIKGSKNKSDYKRYTNVWVINEVGFGTSPKKFKEIRDSLNHDTPKPEEMFKRMILVHTKPGDLVLVPFSGTGVVEKVCIELERNFISFELNKEL